MDGVPKGWQQLPELGRTAVAQQGAVAHREHGRLPTRMASRGAIADGVDTSMESVQPLARRATRNRVRRQPAGDELSVGDDSVLLFRKERNARVRLRGGLISHTANKPPRRFGAPARCASSLNRMAETGVIEKLVEQVEGRFAELQRQMSDPAVISDRERYAAVGREYSALESASELAARWRQVRGDLEGAEEMLAEDGEDAELRQMVADAPEQLRVLEDELRLAMVERDPNDDKNVIIEIRGGAGGDEAALFAGDLFNMLTRYAEERGFKTEVLSQSPAEVGGFKEVTFEIKGDGAYSVFKFEGGTHRVQRVPKTESQGRIHTSTATVAVLPEAEDVDVQIDPNDLSIDVYRSSGPGGQSVNTTDSAVRITHGPTGIVVSMQDEKSQLQNREKAMRVLRARVYERALDEQQAEIAAERKSQVGTGQRSEKVRTYNYPQGRVTDHRIKLTAHNLDEILAGNLSEFTSALASEEKRARLEAQTTGP